MSGGTLATRLTAFLFNAGFYLAHARVCQQFVFKAKYLPNIALPRTLAEKYLWRKIVDRNPDFGVFCDKLATKDWLAKAHPDIRTAKVLWRGRNVADLPADDLPYPVYFKVNNASATNRRLDDASFDRAEIWMLAKRWLGMKHAGRYGEWAYRLVPPTLFVEEDLSEGGRKPIVDFAVYVFAGTVTHISVMIDKEGEGAASFARFDEDGRRMPIPNKRSRKDTLLPDDFVLPVPAAALAGLARRVAEGSDHLRIDLLWNGSAVYLTEITVYSNAGFVDYGDTDLLDRMARAWQLGRSWLLTEPQTGWRALYAGWLRRRLAERGG